MLNTRIRLVSGNIDKTPFESESECTNRCLQVPQSGSLAVICGLLQASRVRCAVSHGLKERMVRVFHVFDGKKPQGQNLSKVQDVGFVVTVPKCQLPCLHHLARAYILVRRR